jgi:hypothetical protein
MTKNDNKFSIDFNYLEMLGLHDYARFKNLNLKDIVLMSIEKQIANDKEYLDSLLEIKRDLFIPSEPELIDDNNSISIVNTNILPVESEHKIKKISKNKPRFLRDEPLVVTKKIKKKKKKVQRKK